jgi:hypothetical protein
MNEWMNEHQWMSEKGQTEGVKINHLSTYNLAQSVISVANIQG